MVNIRSNVFFVGIIISITLMFQSPGSAVPYSYKMNLNFMNAVYELWKPSFPILNTYWQGFTYLFALPYVVLIWVFIRKIEMSSPVLWIAIIYTLAFGFMLAYPVYREPIMPLIILEVFRNKRRREE